MRGTSDAIGRTVEVTLGGEVIGSAVVQANGSWRVNVDLGGASGQLDVGATVSDRAGNTSSDSQSVVADSRFIRVTTKSDGSQGNEDPEQSLGYFAPTVSPDGRYVVFSAYEQGLVPTGDPSPGFELLIKDMSTGKVRLLLSDDAHGAPVTAKDPQFSADGRFLTFSSDSPLLVEGDSTARGGIFRMEMATGELQR